MFKKGQKQTREHVEKRVLSRNGKQVYKSKESKLKALKNLQPSYWLGKKMSKKARINMRNGQIGKKLTPEHKIKISESMKGEKSYLWNGGKSFEPYSVDWTKTLRRSIRERDKYICQICGKEPSLDCHHIDYDKKNCNPDNLITLCRSCHVKTNQNRNYWSKYFNNRV